MRGKPRAFLMDLAHSHGRKNGDIEMKQFRRIGVLTSGGDAPGMNAAVRAVTRAALASGVEVMGIFRGYSGLISGDIKPLAVRDVSNIINKGGTMLYSDRCPEFKTEEGMRRAVETCERFGIDGVVTIGGDGTFRGATSLTAHGVPCVGIPATIDNDITSTDNTIGFDTAMNTVIELVDKLRDTCESHARCSVVEVMGRGAGDIALNSAIASGASAVLIPEIPFDEEKIISNIKKSRMLGKRNFIVLVSEAFGKEFGAALTKKIQEETGIDSRFARFAHLVRGGAPTLRDRVLASEMGVHAVEELLAGNSNLVVCERAGKIFSKDINFALVLDCLYKNTLEDGDLEAFSAEEIEEMKALAKAREDNMKALAVVAKKISL